MGGNILILPGKYAYAGSRSLLFRDGRHQRNTFCSFELRPAESIHPTALLGFVAAPSCVLVPAQSYLFALLQVLIIIRMNGPAAADANCDLSDLADFILAKGGLRKEVSLARCTFVDGRLRRNITSRWPSPGRAESSKAQPD